MNAQQYIQMANADKNGSSNEGGYSPEFYALSDAVDSLSHKERVQLRAALVDAGETRLLRNLYYDYKTQTWID